VTLDVAAVVVDGARALPADGADLAPGQKAIVEVVVRNVGVGHRFPGGVMDAQDTWIELVLEDARGKKIAEAGTLHEASGADPTAHRLASAVAGEDGRPLLERQTHLFRAGVYNHTIAPRDAEIVRYAFTVPSRLPLRAVARLRHRSRTLALKNAACDDVRTARGGAFARASVRTSGRPIDACLFEPVLEIARAEALLGPSASKGEGTFDGLFAHGLALLHERQERLDEARPSFERALERAKDTRQRAMAIAALADLAAGQGRTDDALALAARAGALAPAHPAIARIRGDALLAAWRWGEAAPFYQEAASGAPKDDAAWARLAVSLGGASRDRDALDAAQRGLLLQPRDADMLRVQALALRALAAPTQAADEAFLARRAPDDAPQIRAQCTRDAPGCALERVPVHIHEMR
jgi:tetratricopeptide (TPR) repeat protein